MARKRHLSRIAVMQVLFEVERREADPFESLKLNTAELGDTDAEFAAALLKGVLEKQDDIKQEIENHAPDWSFDRMDPIARCVLLVGGYELLHGNDAPPPVVMDEAIEIAKEYGSAETAKFVNGVLNAITHR